MPYIPPGMLIAVGVASMLTFVGTLAALPLLVTQIPEEYFVSRKRPVMPWRRRHPLLSVLFLIAKNLLGIFFLAAGIIMLFIPGQGIITILLGLTFMNFPGKRRLERALIRRPSVHRSLNWMRRRARRPPLKLPEENRVP